MLNIYFCVENNSNELSMLNMCDEENYSNDLNMLKLDFL